MLLIRKELLVIFGVFGIVHATLGAAPVAVTDLTNYNVGSTVRMRLDPEGEGSAVLRYAGEESVVGGPVDVRGSGYQTLWTVPWAARTGRYEIDIKDRNGKTIRDAGSFVVHRKQVEVGLLELDKTFYTSGDAVNPVVLVRNVSNERVEHVQVEFEAWNFPWIAQPIDEPPAWKSIIDGDLALGPGEERLFHAQKTAVVQAGKEPVAILFSVVVRDNRNADLIYDLAFAPPAFTSPPNQPEPKAYPALYLYTHETDLPHSEAYRRFYPPQFVSDAIVFNTAHTMFGTEKGPDFSFEVKSEATALQARVLGADGKPLLDWRLPGQVNGRHAVTLKPMQPGLYTLEIVGLAAAGAVVAHNRLEFAVNQMPKSVLIFCGHEDDDTAHPGMIRAAVENHIPIHVVYFTGGDGGGCERFYMHSCDAARGLDFAEVRMGEARGSLGHLGVPREDIFFLGIPDGGTEQIWYDHHAADNPYRSVLLASEHAPYRDVVAPNLPFALDPTLAVTKELIARFQPDLIITGHPDERHVDHRTNNWIVVKAMQELLKQGKLGRSTRLLVDVVYGAMPGRHAPYRYRPAHLFVSGEAARLGQEALWYYQTQDGNHQQANIVDYAKLPREEPYPHFEILDWAQHEGWNEKRP